MIKTAPVSFSRQFYGWTDNSAQQQHSLPLLAIPPLALKEASSDGFSEVSTAGAPSGKAQNSPYFEDVDPPVSLQASRTLGPRTLGAHDQKTAGKVAAHSKKPFVHPKMWVENNILRLIGYLNEVVGAIFGNDNFKLLNRATNIVHGYALTDAAFQAAGAVKISREKGQSRASQTFQGINAFLRQELFQLGASVYIPTMVVTRFHDELKAHLVQTRKWAPQNAKTGVILASLALIPLIIRPLDALNEQLMKQYFDPLSRTVRKGLTRFFPELAELDRTALEETMEAPAASGV